MRKTALLLLPILGFCAAAQADDDATTQSYLEAAVGEGTVNYGSLSQNAAPQGVIGGNTTTISLLGGYAFNPNFALELGYHDYGKPTLSQQTSGVNGPLNSCPGSFSCPHVTGITFEAVGRFEIVTDLYGEVSGGVQNWHAGDPAAAYIGKSNGDSAVYGLGVRHDFHDQLEGWSFTIRYEYSEFSTSETRIGLRYSF